MSRSVKIWLLISACFWLAWLLLAFWDFHLALGIAWTFFHSESATGFWMAKGFSSQHALLIAIFFSTVAVSNWFWLANQKLPSFIAKFWNFEPENLSHGLWMQKIPYLALPFISFAPDGGVWFSIAFSKYFRLNKRVSFLLINLGNIVKNILWATFFSFLTRHLQIMGGLLLLVAAIFLACKTLRKKLKPSRS